MDEYFSRLPGMHAERMMRATTSMQVSIDFASEADAVRKLRIATLLGPVFSYLLDNVPVFEGEPNSTPLRRMKVWREVDPARCGAIPVSRLMLTGSCSRRPSSLRVPMRIPPVR